MICKCTQTGQSLNVFCYHLDMLLWVSLRVMDVDQDSAFAHPYTTYAHGGVVLKALHYKLAGHGSDSRWCHWNFSVTILPVALWPWCRYTL